MKRRRVMGAAALLLGLGALNVSGRDWSRAEDLARDLVNDARDTYLYAARNREPQVLAPLFRTWGGSAAFHSLLRSTPNTEPQLEDALEFLAQDFQEAASAIRRSRISYETREQFDRARDRFGELRQEIRHGGYRPPDPSQVIGLTLASDGWHGNFFERYTRLSGTFRGLDLRQADLIVTDEEGYSLWHRDNAFPEIQEHYATHKYLRPAVVEVSFSERFYLRWVPPGAAYIFVRLRDQHGNTVDQSIPVPREGPPFHP